MILASKTYVWVKFCSVRLYIHVNSCHANVFSKNFLECCEQLCANKLEIINKVIISEGL